MFLYGTADIGIQGTDQYLGIYRSISRHNQSNKAKMLSCKLNEDLINLQQDPKNLLHSQV